MENNNRIRNQRLFIYLVLLFEGSVYTMHTWIFAINSFRAKIQVVKMILSTPSVSFQTC